VSSATPASRRPALAAGGSVRPSLDPLSQGPGPNSRRVSGGSSIAKSERPDLSWLDDSAEADGQLDDSSPAPPSASIGQSVTYAILGLMGGAILGGMLSIVLASVLSTECFADKCILRYLTVCSAIGAVAGIIAGIRFARTSQHSTPDTPPEIGR
jgi:hypothetical protein